MTFSPRKDSGSRRRLRGAVAAILLGGTVLSGTVVGLNHDSNAAAPLNALPGSFADLVEQVSPAVVTISAVQTAAPGMHGRQMPQLPPGLEDFFRRFGQPTPQAEPAPRQGTALGSGFIIDKDGYVVTNNHVVENASDITVTLQDGREIGAELVGRDPKTDLALLKVESDEAMPYLEFGDSDSVRVGDWVVAVGNPFGLGGSVTAGIVSARGRDINAGPYDDFIQTDAAINRGNSGGPAFDSQGRVIGINTAIFSPSGGSVGIGFAIPANLAKPILAQLKEDGHVSRGWLGVQIQEVTPEIAEGLGVAESKGALVAVVQPGSPAAEAGFEPGDVVLSYDGKAIETVKDLTRAVAATPAGSGVAVVVRRGGEERTINTTIRMLDDNPQMASAEQPAGDGSDVLGLKLATLDAAANAGLEIDPEAKGVLVVGVDDGPAGAALRPGDVIVAVGDTPVAAPADVTGQVKAAEAAGKKAVLMLVNRRGSQQFVAVELRRA